MKYEKNNVPVIMQTDAVEGGAACLAMILAYYDKWLSLSEIRGNMGVSRDGADMSDIVYAAKRYDLKVNNYECSLEEILSKANPPCIISWEKGRFVVLTGISKKGYHINDPAIGGEVLAFEQFQCKYSGNVIEFEPNENFKPKGQNPGVLSFAKKRLAGAKGALVFVSLAGIAAAFLGMIEPILAQTFLDKILVDASTVRLIPFVCIVFALAVAYLLLYATESSYMTYVQGKFAVTANCTYLEHILRLPINFFSSRRSGDILGRQKDNANIARIMIKTLTPIGVGIIAMLAYLFLMLSISPTLTLIGVANLIINILVIRNVSRKRVAISRKISRDKGVLSASTASILSSIETIKASGAEEGTFKQWAGEQASVASGEAKNVEVNTFIGNIPEFLANISNAVLLALGAFLIINGQITSGMLLSMQSLLQSFMSPLQNIISVGQEIAEMRTKIERIEDVMEHEEDAVFNYDVSENAFSEIKGHVSIRNVTFGYSHKNPPLIEDFSLELPPGRKVALVGGSGCGKSTISKLVAGLYQPWSGEILFDGKPMTAYERSVFTGAVAIVDQDIVLFPESIKESFRFSDGTIDDSRIVQAAKSACIHDAILHHDNGYDTMITEGGTNFSGGQKQLLEIARILAADPAVILFDEATSALDAKTEAKVMETVNELGITMLIVAHRLSTIRDADEILVIDNGRVIERGTHQELMALGGEYLRLVAAM